MPFGVVSGVGRGIGVLDGMEIVEGKGSFGGKCGASHSNQWGLCGVVILCREGWRRGSSHISLRLLVDNLRVCFSVRRQATTAATVATVARLRRTTPIRTATTRTWAVPAWWASLRPHRPISFYLHPPQQQVRGHVTAVVMVTHHITRR